MDLNADAWIPFPRSVVFAAYRDELDKLTEYLPNVRRIELRSRTGDPPVVDLVNIWHGGGEIPPVARAFVSEQMLSWTDYAHWDEAAWTCEWRIETHAFSEAVTCRGKNTFVEEGGKTRLEIRGNLVIDSSRVRGVPRLLVSTVNRAVEELLGSRIRPNLLDVSAGLTKYLERKE
jgi:hypothetical protein